MYREPNGTVWAGTLHQGLSRLRNGTWHTFTTKDGLPSDSISVITGNESGLIFVGTPNGLAELRNDRWTSYNTHDGLPPGAIESLFLDGSDTLWIGTSRGIAFLRSGAVHVPLGAPTALYGDILGIAEKNGWLWIATSDHILRVRCSALLKQAYAEGDYREFGVTDGLPSVEGVKRSPSVELDNRGNIWFSLKQGISFLPASAFADPAFPVTMRIEGMLVDGKHVATGDHIRISSGRHRLTFQYAGINVSNPEAVRYHYRLADVDSSWSEPTPCARLTLRILHPDASNFRSLRAIQMVCGTPMELQLRLKWSLRYFKHAGSRQRAWGSLPCSRLVYIDCGFNNCIGNSILDWKPGSTNELELREIYTIRCCKLFTASCFSFRRSAI